MVEFLLVVLILSVLFPHAVRSVIVWGAVLAVLTAILGAIIAIGFWVHSSFDMAAVAGGILILALLLGWAYILDSATTEIKENVRQDKERRLADDAAGVVSPPSWLEKTSFRIGRWFRRS